MSEAQRLERLRKTVRRGLLAGGVVLLAAAAGGGWAWERHSLHTAQAKASDRYFAALALQEASGSGATEHEKAAAQFADLAAHAPEGVRSYAAMRLADYKARTDKKAEAVTLWKRVSDDRAADPALRGLARYLQLNAELENAPADQPTDQLRAGFEALAKEGGPWMPLAWEGLAALDLRPGATKAQHDEARRLLKEIQASPASSAPLRERASLVVQTLGDAG